MAEPQHRRGGVDPAPPRSTAYHNLAETSHFTFPSQGTVKTHHPWNYRKSDANAVCWDFISDKKKT